MLVFAYNRIYDLQNFEKILAECPAHRRHNSRIIRRHAYGHRGEWDRAPKTIRLSQARCLGAAFRTDPNHPLRNAMRDNNVYDWTPQAPVRLYHSHGDQAVPFNNAQKAYDTFIARGACCVAISDPSGSLPLDHVPSQYPSVLGAKQWFDSFRQ